jgi:hypothetical protein
MIVKQVPYPILAKFQLLLSTNEVHVIEKQKSSVTCIRVWQGNDVVGLGREDDGVAKALVVDDSDGQVHVHDLGELDVEKHLVGVCLILLADPFNLGKCEPIQPVHSRDFTCRKGE